MNDSINEIIEGRRKDLKKEVQEENVFPGVMEQMAEFRDGGMYGLERFLYKNLRWPEGVDENKSGRVLVRFLVDKDGTVKSAEILQTASPEFGNEVLRVINLMPKWAPAYFMEFRWQRNIQFLWYLILRNNREWIILSPYYVSTDIAC